MEKLIKELKKELKFTLYFPKEGQENLYGDGGFGTLVLPMTMPNYPGVMPLLAVHHVDQPIAPGHASLSMMEAIPAHSINLRVQHMVGYVKPDRQDEVKEKYYPSEAEILADQLSPISLMLQPPIFRFKLYRPYGDHFIFPAGVNTTPNLKKK